MSKTLVQVERALYAVIAVPADRTFQTLKLGLCSTKIDLSSSMFQGVFHLGPFGRLLDCGSGQAHFFREFVGFDIKTEDLEGNMVCHQLIEKLASIC